MGIGYRDESWDWLVLVLFYVYLNGALEDWTGARTRVGIYQLGDVGLGTVSFGRGNEASETLLSSTKTFSTISYIDG